MLKTCLVIFTCLTTSLLVTSVEASDNRQIRHTQQGEIEGFVEGNSIHFRGIPYALPPVGDLRWQPPAPSKAWQGIKAAQHFGPICPQKRLAAIASEDCLSLNVSVPVQSPEDARLPVVVWIHGGGLVAGAGSAPTYNSEKWNKENIILVTLNYRLGAMGFFAHPAIDQTHGVNFGLMDMVAGLEWVQSNISHFGGDPSKITIMGASAGGMAVQMLMVTPDARGLFSGAISHSGYGNWPKPRTRSASPLAGADSAEQLSIDHARKAAALSKQLRVPQTLEALQDINAQVFADAYSGFQLPLIDKLTLPEESGQLFARGLQHPVPYIAGASSFDGSVFPGAKMSEEAVLAMLGDQQASARQLYQTDFEHAERRGVERLFGDMRYVESAHFATQFMHKVERKGYLFLFDYLPEGKENSLPGATHVSEVPLLFGSDIPVAKSLRQYWINFVRTGNPNGEGQPQWSSTEGNVRHWMVFQQKPEARQNVLADKMKLIEGRYLNRVSPLALKQ